MKLSSFVVVATSLLASTMAQSIDIGAPLNGSSVAAGQNITVEVDQPNSLTGSEEVAIVISMIPCDPSGCSAPDEDIDANFGPLGDVLYNGLYNPQYDNSTPPDHKPPYQNFSVQVPSWYTSGEQVALAVTHISLYGAGPFVLLEAKNVSLIVE